MGSMEQSKKTGCVHVGLSFFNEMKAIAVWTGLIQCTDRKNLMSAPTGGKQARRVEDPIRLHSLWRATPWRLQNDQSNNQSMNRIICSQINQLISQANDISFELVFIRLSLNTGN